MIDSFWDYLWIDLLLVAYLSYTSSPSFLKANVELAFEEADQIVASSCLCYIGSLKIIFLLWVLFWFSGDLLINLRAVGVMVKVLALEEPGAY